MTEASYIHPSLLGTSSVSFTFTYYSLAGNGYIACMADLEFSMAAGRNSAVSWRAREAPLMDMPSTWLVSGVHCKGRDALLLTIKAISCKIMCPSVAHPHPGELLGLIPC